MHGTEEKDPKEKNIEELVVRLNQEISITDGLALTGENSDGKTRLLKKLAQSYYNNNFQCIYIPEHIKDFGTDLTKEDKGLGVILNTGEKKDLPDISPILEERLNTKNDDLKDIIPYILRENKSDSIFNFFKEKLKFELSFNSDGSVEIRRNRKRTFEKLTSTGFKLMVRITAEIYFYLKKFDDTKVTYILVDEIDDKLYWNNRSIFFKELFKFLKSNFPNIKFIFSTNMPESIYSLPKKVDNKNANFKIIKISQDENSIIDYQSYNSNDFLTENSIDKVIFDKKATFIEKSDNYKELERIYMICLKCNRWFTQCNFCGYYVKGIWNSNSYTPKEKIIYDAIMELRR